MPQTSEHDSVLNRGGRLCRMVTAALIAGVRRNESLDEIEGRVADLPPGDQALIVGTTLGGLFLLSLIAAQFGLVGLGLYFLGVIFLVN